MSNSDFQDYINSIPRLTIEEAQEILNGFDSGKARVESYVPGYGKLKIRIKKNLKSMIVSLSECNDFDGLTEFTINGVKIDLMNNGGKLLTFGKNSFKAKFETLLFLECE